MLHRRNKWNTLNCCSEARLICWYQLKVLFAHLICDSDGMIFKCIGARGVVPQASPSHPFLSITTARGKGVCWTYLESQDRSGWERPLAVMWSNAPLKARPAMKSDEAQRYVVQASFEYFQGQGCCNTAGQSLPAPNCSHCQNSFYHIQWEFTLWPLAALVLLLCTWGVSGSIFCFWRHQRDPAPPSHPKPSHFQTGVTWLQLDLALLTDTLWHRLWSAVQTHSPLVNGGCFHQNVGLYVTF